MSERADLVVVGAGPGGLSAAWAGRRRGWRTVVLEATDGVGGLWRRVRPEMRCLSLRRWDVLPDGVELEGAADRATAAEVLAGWEAFAERARLDLRLGVRAQGLVRDGGWRVEGAGVVAPRVVLATGAYAKPWVPSLPDSFDGPSSHGQALDVEDVAAGERVLVVGYGNSAAELVPRLLARGAEVTLSARQPLPPTVPIRRGVRGRLGWMASGLPVRWAPRLLGCPDGVPVVDDDVQRAIEDGRVRLVGPTTALWPGGAEAGARVEADRIVFTTGYRRDLGWVPGLTLDRGEPAHREGLSTDLPGVAFLGFPCMRTRRSGFLRGLVDDARAVVGAL